MSTPRRILILSTTFFPDPQVGAIRMTQWCRHLPSLGWTPRALTRQYQMTATPENLASGVHPDVTVRYLNDAPPAVQGAATPRVTPRQRLKQLIGKVMLGLFVPDPGIVFWRSSRARALAEVKAFNPDVILSTSPTHSVHDLGRWLSKTTGIPWVADFRDVYLIDFSWYYGPRERLSWPRHRAFDQAIYDDAAAIIHAIPLHGRWARRRYRQARDKIVILPNGYPAELLDPELAPRPASQPGRLAIRVVGTVEDPDLLRLAGAIERLVRDKLDLELCVLGRRPACAEQIARLLGDRFIAPGYVPHRQALGYVKGASLLVSYLNDHRSRSFQLTSKLFEFIASGQPTLEINPSQPDLGLLRAYDVPYLRSPSVEQLAAKIKSMLTDPSDRSAAVEQFRAIYARKNQTRALADVLTRVVARKKPAL